MRERLAGVLELLDAPRGPRCCRLVSASSPRLERAGMAIAREAAMRGLVPVATTQLTRLSALPPADRRREMVLLVPPAGIDPPAVALAAGLVASGTRLWAVVGMGCRWPGVAGIDLDAHGGQGAYGAVPATQAARAAPLVADGRPGERPGRAARDGAAAIESLLSLGRAFQDRLDGGGAIRLFEAAFVLARVGWPRLEGACRVALADGWLTQGRPADALALVAPTHGWDVDAGAAACLVRARARLAQGRLADAGTAVAMLLGRGAPTRVPAPRVRVVAAQLHVAIGDLDGVRRHVAAGLRDCRRAGCPDDAVLLRAVKAVAVARHGERAELVGAVRDLRRARGQVRSLAARQAAERALATARSLRSGRWPGQGGEAASRWEGGGAVSDELLELLTICHEAEDDGPALERLCASLRERLVAASVCVFGDDAVGRLVAVGQPRGPSPEIARRAVSTGRLVPASLVCDGWEAAAPVRYGGQTIGAVTCRWPVDAALDPGRVDRVLSTAAAACAPSLRAALERRAASPVACADDLGLLGTSRAIAAVREAIRRAASAPFQVLIEGESGSGKELVARAVHRVGPRRQRRLCAINCAALPEDLLEAELFGHTRGAFTGAVVERAGVFEEADGGTLFLDEVSELSPRAQAKLLRVLQESEVRRVGEGLPRRVDVRIVAATNKSLAREAEAGRFRVDLRYRLEVIRIAVPPLRERREDVPLLAARFWSDFSARAGSRALLDRTAVDALTRYDWPGNVRELQNVMAAVAVHAPRRGRVLAGDLPASLRAGTWLPACTLDEARRAFEVSFVRDALRRAGGRRAAVARELGLTRQGLCKLLVRLGLAAGGVEAGDAAVSETSAAPRGGARPGATA